MKPGMRVIRGPDWASKKQDGGEGHTGTLVYVPKKGSSDDRVTVIWDSGRELRYRAGLDGKYDLRVLDNGPADVDHDTVTCDSCDAFPVTGFRWKCSACDDFDLCTTCYMSGEHDLTHGFLRIDEPHSTEVAVPCRSQSKLKRVHGIFPNASVIRGPHWKWKNDDGESGEEGKVTRIVPWNETSFQGGAEVKWRATKKTGTYRLGGEGSVDVIYSEESSPGSYYFSHLPVVGVLSPGETTLKCSDKVQVFLDLKHFKQLQDDSDDWDDEMVQCINEVGTITQLLRHGKTAVIQYEDQNTWLVNRQAVTRIHSFSCGEAVHILNDETAVRELQDGHGGWSDDLKQDLGKFGRILNIADDGDVLVKVDQHRWMLNPVCCQPIEDVKLQVTVPELAASDRQVVGVDGNAEMVEQFQKMAATIASIFTSSLRKRASVDPDERAFVEAAATGNLNKVKAIIEDFPEMVNSKLEGRTGLQLASHEGHCVVISYLLDNKADINVTDKDGDTALHYTAFGQEEAAMKILLDQGAAKDKRNNNGVTAIHITVAKANLGCSKLLLSKNSSVNIKSKAGDTVMHDCILQKKHQHALLKAVFGARGADFTIVNDKGFNVLHWATLKNCSRAVEIILSKNKNIVNLKMEDGFTALHIAAATNNVDIASMFLEESDKNEPDGDGRTPLHIAVSQGHQRMVELLITIGCDINIQDSDGNTPLHLTQTSQALPRKLAELLGVDGKDDTTVGIHTSCLLLEAGANLDIKNQDGDTPLNLCPDLSTQEFMQRIAKQAATKSFAVSSRSGNVRLPSHWANMAEDEYLTRIDVYPSTSDLLKQEYQQIEKNFRKTLPQAKIIKVERIQNKFLWEHYSVNHTRFEAEYGPGKANQRDAYHGTLSSIVNRICDENFDPRLHGDRTGTLFGKGAYFASDAKYADKYAKAENQQQKYIFQVKILAGKMTYGDPSYKRPPPINVKDPKSRLYDSCVDDPGDPRIFCLFDVNQFYPEYLIEYYCIKQLGY